MPQPERENLRVITDIDNRVTAVHINPKKLTTRELRNILKGQIYCQKPREILIKDELDSPFVLYVRTEELESIRVAPRQTRQRFITLTTKLMKQASQIVIQESTSQENPTSF